MSLTIQKKFTISDHTAPVYALEKIDENTFISGGGDRIVSTHNIYDPSLTHGIINTGSTIYSLCFIENKNILLAGVSGGGIHVIDLNAKKEIHFLLNHEKGIFDLKYSEVHNIFISAGGDGKISFWNGVDFSFISSQKLCEEKIRSIALNTSESIAAIGCGDGTIRIFDIKSATEINSIKAHSESVNALYFHPSQNILISGGKNAHLNLWDIFTFQLLESIPAHNFAIYSIIYLPEYNFFATGSRDKNIKIWDAENLMFLTRIDKEKNEGHIHSVNKLLWLDNTLISTGDDRKIIGWEITK